MKFTRQHLNHNYNQIFVIAVILTLVLNTLLLTISGGFTHSIKTNQKNIIPIQRQINQQKSKLNYQSEIPPVTLEQLKQQTKFIITTPNTRNTVFNQKQYRQLLVVDGSSQTVIDWTKLVKLENLPTEPIVVETSHKTTHNNDNLSVLTKSIKASSANIQAKIQTDINHKQHIINVMKSSISTKMYLNKVIRAIYIIDITCLVILGCIIMLLPYRKFKRGE